MNKTQIIINYFHSTSRFCHLVLLVFIVISQSYSFAQITKKNTKQKIEQKLEQDFLKKILEQIVLGQNLNKQPQSPLDAFEIFQKKNETNEIWVSYWQYDTYKYPLFVQLINNQIEDFFLTFPSFMLHDKIHELLISTWGKQQFYQQSNLSAIYSWKNLANKTQGAIYEANCSITCFPVSLSLQKLKMSEGIIPLWQQFHRQGLSTKKKK